MKAKEYVAKYKSRILLDDYHPSTPIVDEESRALAIKEMEEMTSTAISEMFRELNKEAEAIVKTRNAKTSVAQAAAYREINDKWNAIAERINAENGGKEILKRDAIKNFWFDQVPEIRAVWDFKHKTPVSVGAFHRFPKRG